MFFKLIATTIFAAILLNKVNSIINNWRFLMYIAPKLFQNLSKNSILSDFDKNNQ